MKLPRPREKEMRRHVLMTKIKSLKDLLLQIHIYVHRPSETGLLDISHFQLSACVSRKILMSESPLSNPAYTIQEDHTAVTIPIIVLHFKVKLHLTDIPCI